MHDASTLRAHFPEFANTTDYPDAQVNFWLGVADKALDVNVWGDLLDMGAELYACHNIAIATKNQRTAAAGGIPGTVTGPQSSKAVDKVSSSHDTGAVIHAGAGHWNLTTYGIQFYNLVRIVGAAGVQL